MASIALLQATINAIACRLSLVYFNSVLLINSQITLGIRDNTVALITVNFS